MPLLPGAFLSPPQFISTLSSTVTNSLQESPPHRRFLAGRSSPFSCDSLAEQLMFRFALVVQAMSCLWSVKTRRSRHCRDARADIYYDGRTTAAMNENMSTPPPATPENIILIVIRRCHPHVKKGEHKGRSPPHERFLVGCSSPLMRVAQHLLLGKGTY